MSHLNLQIHCYLSRQNYDAIYRALRMRESVELGEYKLDEYDELLLMMFLKLKVSVLFCL